MVKFSERLKGLRIEKKLSQKGLALKLNVDQRTISNWETGFRQPDIETLARLAMFFDVSTDYLLGLQD